MFLSNGERLIPHLLIIDHCTSDNKKLVVHPHVWTHNEFFICIHLGLPGLRKYALDEILRRDALVFHHAANGFSQHARHGEFLHLRTVATIWNAVGEHHFFQG